jgi:hypothetical protein
MNLYIRPLSSSFNFSFKRLKKIIWIMHVPSIFFLQPFDCCELNSTENQEYKAPAVQINLSSRAFDMLNIIPISLIENKIYERENSFS